MNGEAWAAAGQEVVETLQSLLRLDTTNPPGNEIIAADWLAAALRAEGLEPTVLESAPGRGNVVARLRGSGEEAPLLLMSHTDVVPAEPDQWEHPPFSGAIVDEVIWGRGALDMKHIVAQHLSLMRLFKRKADQGKRLRRDLIFMSAADEERSGTFGAQWMVENHADLIRAEYALNEGGGGTFKYAGSLVMSVQTAEKGLARFKLIARGRPGHASIPQQDNAVVRLAEAVAAIGRARLPTHLTATARAYLTGLASLLPAEAGDQLRAVLEAPEGLVALLDALPLEDLQRRYLYAITHNTAAPTVLHAGSKVNVFPSEAVARVDGRTLPGFDHASFRAELAPHLPEGVELEFEDEGEPLESGVDSPLFSAIQKVVGRHEPAVTLLPSLLTGATDAKAVVKMGTKVYGFSPGPYEPEFDGLSLVHGHNERISIHHLTYGLRLLHDVIEEFCGA